MSIYMSHFTKEEALNEYETLADQLRNGQLEWYDYWQTLSMREGFEDGTWNLSADDRSRLDELDAIVRKHLLPTVDKHKRTEEYHNLGKHRPAEYWWWHLGVTA